MTVEENLANGEIRYIDRRDGEVKTEVIYGERSLRWAYGNPLGRLAQWLLVRRWIVSAWYGRRMNTVSSRVRIKPFIEQMLAHCGCDLDSCVAHVVESFF